VESLRVEDTDPNCEESSSIEGLFGIPQGRLPRSVSGESDQTSFAHGYDRSGELMRRSKQMCAGACARFSKRPKAASARPKDV
jgi:hypothetical protein